MVNPHLLTCVYSALFSSTVHKPNGVGYVGPANQNFHQRKLTLP
ncbi:Uncharacterised protein [Vibrio cholerae]|nr:Uncharacterised protein [Vibrio cholerae]